MDKKIADEIHDCHHSIFLLYNPEGQQLVDFETTIGQNGENTCFEPSRKGRGITYKKLNNPISLSSGGYHSSYGICNVLIDQKGNSYGDFYHIAGQIPNYVGKSSTRYPKYIDKKILCLSLPKEDYQPPRLTIVNEDGTHTVTVFECPWLISNISGAFIKDKEKYVRLIDLAGKKIENTIPITFRSLSEDYKKQFLAQKKP